MTWIVQPLQKATPRGNPSGIWHLCCQSDEGGGTVPCCRHDHLSPDEAERCPAAIERSHQVTGIRPPEPRPICSHCGR